MLFLSLTRIRSDGVDYESCLMYSYEMLGSLVGIGVGDSDKKLLANERISATEGEYAQHPTQLRHTQPGLTRLHATRPGVVGALNGTAKLTLEV